MTTSRTAPLADRLAAYADSLRDTGAICTHAVHAAFATVPRHRFLSHFRYRADEYTLDANQEPPGEVLDIVYANNSLLTHTGQDGDPASSSSAPSTMAKTSPPPTLGTSPTSEESLTKPSTTTCGATSAPATQGSPAPTLTPTPSTSPSAYVPSSTPTPAQPGYTPTAP